MNAAFRLEVTAQSISTLNIVHVLGVYAAVDSALASISAVKFVNCCRDLEFEA